MVLKLYRFRPARRSSFENDVKTYGTQTVSGGGRPDKAFENDVKTYGTQT